jgi:hypothetical protein
MMQQTQRGQGLNRPGLVVRAKHDLRELLGQGFEVAVVKDATAGPKHPEWGYGYTAALINYAFLAHAVWITDQAVKAMEEGGAAASWPFSTSVERK